MTAARISNQAPDSSGVGVGIFSVVVFLVLAGLFEFSMHQLAQQKAQAALDRHLENANAVRIVLESEITTAAALATGIESYIVARRGEILAEDIEPMMGLIYERSGLFRNIGLAPDNRIQYMFPLEGNQSALGMKYEDNPKQWPSVKKAMESRKGLLVGPITLVQGGKGLIYRQPVFIDGTYWGMMSTVLDADRLFRLLDPLSSDQNLIFGLQVVDDAGQVGDVFAGTASVFDLNPSLLTITLPGARWQLAVASKPVSDIEMWPLRIVGWFVALVVVWLFRLLMRLHWQHTTLERLEDMVAQRTQQIGEVNGVLQSVLNAASEVAIIAVDTHGLITLFNVGAQRMLGYHAIEVEHHGTPERFYRAEDLARRAEELQDEFGESVTGFRSLSFRVEKLGHEASECRYLCKDGTDLPVFVMVTAIRSPSDELTGYLFVVENMTERKRVDRLKSEFIATVSHELRTPLTAITGVLGLVVGGVLGELPAKAHELLGVAHKNSQRLKLLINDLLDMEKLVAGQMRFDLKSQELMPLLERALKDNQAYADQFCVMLEIDSETTDCMVSVDAHRLQQVFSNLLSNAVKFSPSGGRVIVAVERHESSIRVQVKDQGSGIPAEFHARIFQKFAQADSSDSRQKGGTGLGLAITRELVERMGGKVGFESIEGQGTTFWFDLKAV